MADRTVTIRLEAKDELRPVLKGAAGDAKELSAALGKDLPAQTGNAAKGFKAVAQEAAAVSVATKGLASTGSHVAALTGEVGKASTAWERMSTAAGSAAGRVLGAYDRMRDGITGAAVATSGFVGRIQPAVDASRRAAEQFDAVGAAGRRLALMGAVVGGGFAVAAKATADFDKEMSAVAAGTQASGDALGRLRAAALDLNNANLGFGPREAAQAITELGKAGVATADITNGALRGALSLAAAGTLDVGEAAETAASAMTQFNLQGKDVPHIADLLANGANKAQGSVHDLGMALSQAGLVASGVGASIDETVGALAAFASAGLIGSDAGTSFKTMLQRLTPQSKEAAGEMERLGISAYDSSGKFIGLSKYAENLKTSLSGMSDESRNAALGVMFGSDAIRAANILYKEGASGINEWTEKVREQGGAARTAATLTNNLAGDMAKLRASIEVNLIQGGTGANDSLRGMVQAMTGFVNAVGSVPAPVIAAGSAVLMLSGGLLMAIPRIAATKAALIELGVTASGVGNAIGIAIGRFVWPAAVLTGTVLMVQTLSDLAVQANNFKTTTDGVASALTGLAAGVQNNNQLMDLMSHKGTILNTTLKNNDEALARFGDTAATFTGRFNLLNNAFDVAGAAKFRDEVSKLDDALASMVNSGRAQAADTAFRKFMESAEKSGANVDYLRGMFEKYAPAAENAARAAKEAAAATQDQAGRALAASGATDDLAKKSGASADAAKAATDAYQKLTGQLAALGGALLALRGSEVAWEAAIDSATAAVRQNGVTLDINTEKGRANRTALDAMVTAAGKHMEAMLKNGESIDKVNAFAQTSSERFVAMAHSMGMTIPEARALASQLGFNKERIAELSAEVARLQPYKKVEITTTADSAVSGVQRLRNAIDALYSKTVTVTTINQSLQTFGKYGLLGYDGGIIESYANGGMRFGSMAAMSESHVAQIARAGAMRVWAEPETGGEAYIPLSPSKRQRSEDILAQVAKMFGYSLERYAEGGLRTFGRPTMTYATAPAGRRGEERGGPQVNVTNYYPQAEPASVTTNRALQQAAAVGL